MFKRTIATLTILTAVLCLSVKVDVDKPTKWLIYWYVCGTDIETTKIAFGTGTDLMLDEPNACILSRKFLEKKPLKRGAKIYVGF